MFLREIYDVDITDEEIEDMIKKNLKVRKI